MSIGSAVAAKASKSKRVDYSGLFDWAAEHLRLATPENVVRTLMSVDVYNNYSEALREYVPRAHYNTLQHFKRLTPQERTQRAQAWFANIQPGRIAFHEP